MPPTARIYVIETGVNLSYSLAIQNLFPSYTVTTVTSVATQSSQHLPVTNNATATNCVITTQESKDNLAIKWALNDCKTNYPNDYCVIIFDVMTFVASINDADNILQTAITSNENSSLIFDILFLFRYLDHCKTYSGKVNVPGTNYNLFKSDGTNGRYALMFSVKGRERVLNNTLMLNGQMFIYPFCHTLDAGLKYATEHGWLSSAVVVPSLFQLNLEISQDIQMTELCEPLPVARHHHHNNQCRNTRDMISIAMIIIGVVIIAMLAFSVKKNKYKR